MFDIFGIPSTALFGQLLLGLINGSFYALLSLGLAVIFGMLNIVNFSHGAQYMMGAFMAYLLLQYLNVNYFLALLIAPIIVGITGVIIERNLISQLYRQSKLRIIVFLGSIAILRVLMSFFLDPMLSVVIAIIAAAVITEVIFAFASFESASEPTEHIYGLLLTFGLALITEGLFRHQYGSAGLPYTPPEVLTGGRNLGFMFLPNYRAWVIAVSLVVCLATWFVIERTKLGSYLRAATENPTLVRAFGINVPRMITLTYGFGVGLAGLAGVLAAPAYNVSPQMGSGFLLVGFGGGVDGRHGFDHGAIVTGFALGIVEGLTKVFWSEASNTVIFVIMIIVLLIRPAGL